MALNTNDNDSPTLDEMWELEQRFNGPIPEQYVNLERQQRRRRLGLLALLEDQATRYLDAAQRIEAEIEELRSDDPEKMAEKIRMAMNNRERMIRDAGSALLQAADIRRQLRLPPSPILAAVEFVKGVAAN